MKADEATIALEAHRAWTVPQTVKMWQWVVFHPTDSPELTKRFYESETELRAVEGCRYAVKRAEWTRIEAPL